jgi:crossover junction endodeoxyribonuclease RusA
VIEFHVPGVPRPKGSTRVVGHAGKRAIVRASNADLLEPWCAMVGYAARAACRKSGAAFPLADAAFRVGLTYVFARPKGHFGAKGLRAAAPAEHTQRPDVDKLERAALDAMTGIVWADDCQVVGHLEDDGKRWASAGEAPGMLVQIRVLGGLDERRAKSDAGWDELRDLAAEHLAELLETGAECACTALTTCTLCRLVAVLGDEGREACVAAMRPVVEGRVR